MRFPTLVSLALLAVSFLHAAEPLPTVDLSQDTARHVIIAQGTAEVYQGHPVTTNDPRVVAAQYFGTQVFFNTYDARLDAPLTSGLRTAWESAFKHLQQGTLNPAQIVVAVHAAESQDSPATDQARGAHLLALWKQLKP